MSGTSSDQPRQNFFSKLRQRSAIIFTIGLAISVASFVENLHMGKDAIAYVVNELSKVQGWEDIVRAAAAVFHGALEWWRGVLRDLLSFLPFRIPDEWHDASTILLFSTTRAWSAGGAAVRSVAEIGMQNMDEESMRKSRRWFELSRLSSALRVTAVLVVLPMGLLMLLDYFYAGLSFAAGVSTVWSLVAAFVILYALSWLLLWFRQQIGPIIPT